MMFVLLIHVCLSSDTVSTKHLYSVDWELVELLRGLMWPPLNLYVSIYFRTDWRKQRETSVRVKQPRPGLEPGMPHIPRRSDVHWTMTQTCGTAFPGSSPAVQIWSLFRLRFDDWHRETYRQTGEMGFPISMWERLEEQPLCEPQILCRIRSTFMLN